MQLQEASARKSTSKRAMPYRVKSEHHPHSASELSWTGAYTPKKQPSVKSKETVTSRGSDVMDSSTDTAQVVASEMDTSSSDKVLMEGDID